MSARVLYVLCCATCACASLAGAVAATPAPPATPAPAPFPTAAEIVNASTLLHTADHEVTRLGVLVADYSPEDKIVFFIESAIGRRGKRVDYGLYALNRDVKTKLLDNARDIAVVKSAAAYFASRDGIYTYNKEKNAAQKYGSVRDEVVSLAVEHYTGVMYYLNGRHQLYKVTEAGNKSSIVNAVQGAEEIVVGDTGHLYYYTAEHKFYLYDGRDVRPVQGMPEGATRVWFVKLPKLAADEGCVIVGADHQLYVMREASAENVGGSDLLDASAVSADAVLWVYFALDRRIYEFSLLEVVLEVISEAFKKLFKVLLITCFGLLLIHLARKISIS